MKNLLKTLALLITLISCNNGTDYDEQILVQGLHEDVEIIRDEAGINHIYAGNQHDLFMAQGYCAARDRLFQFEIWRRQATGTLAEILGPRELNRDIGTRLFMYRGDMKKELQHYHPDGEAIIKAYVDGVNAYVREVLENPDLLPVTFKALNISPQEWTPDSSHIPTSGPFGKYRDGIEHREGCGEIGSGESKGILLVSPPGP